MRPARHGEALTSSSAAAGRCRRLRTPRRAMPIDSPSVGCGWMVLPMSAGSQPISIARQISLIRSPACVPTMPPPITRCVASSKISLVKPSSRPLAIARPEAAHGNTALPYLMPCGLALLLGLAGPRHLGVGVGHRGNLARVEERLARRARPRPPHAPRAPPCAPASAGRRCRRSRRCAARWCASACRPR